MVYSVLIFAFRKQGTTPNEFKAHYEGSHVPLVKSLAGPHFPISHTRTYLHRTEDTNATGDNNAKYPASVMIGNQSDFDYDAFAELKFKDQGAFGAFFNLMQTPENAEKIAADEEKFLDRPKMAVVVVGEVNVTTGE